MKFESEYISLNTALELKFTNSPTNNIP